MARVADLQPSVLTPPPGLREARRAGALPAPTPNLAVQARSRRVTLLVLATIVMGVADLVFTLTYMQSVGLIETNPIARSMINLGGADQLIRYKLFTIALSAGILYLLRTHRAAERCAWLCALTLAALSAHWLEYNSLVLHEPAFANPAAAAAFDDRWVLPEDLEP